jgi:hypothetical protein
MVGTEGFELESFCGRPSPQAKSRAKLKDLPRATLSILIFAASRCFEIYKIDYIQWVPTNSHFQNGPICGVAPDARGNVPSVPGSPLAVRKPSDGE